MALLFMDSFDHYGTADVQRKWTQRVPSTANDASALGAVGRHSSNGWNFATNSFNVRSSDRLAKVLPAGDSTCVAGFALVSICPLANHWPNTDPEGFGNQSTSVLFTVYQAGIAQVWFRLNPAGTISCYRHGNVSTLLNTTAFALSQGSYAFLEFKVFIDGTVGRIAVRKDGVLDTVLDGTVNFNTKNPNTPGVRWDEIRIGGFAAFTQNMNLNIDDVYVLDGTTTADDPRNDFLGDVACYATFPNADGTTSGSTPSAGARFSTVDEPAFNGDTDYNDLPTAGLFDTLNFPNTPAPGAAILGVGVSALCKKVTAGAATLRAVTRLGSTNYFGPIKGVPGDYGAVQTIFAQKPSDSADWTDSDYNAAEFGYEKQV